MEAKNKVFYVLDLVDTHFIFLTVDEAVNKLKTIVQTKKPTNSEKSKILEVDLSQKQWEIKQVPWSEIAIALMEIE